MAKETSKKAVENTSVAVVGQYTLSQIPDLLSQINEKIKSLEGDSDDTNIISGPIDHFGELKDITEPLRLMEVYNYVTKKMNGIAEVAEVFKAAAPTMKTPAIKIAGAGLPTLQKAILARYIKATSTEVLRGLKDTKKLLEECLSEEDKKVAKLQNAATALQNLLGA